MFSGQVSPSVPPELYTLFCRVHTQEPLGLPKFLCASLPACHGLRTPADLPILAVSDARVLPLGALQPSASATSALRSGTSAAGCAVTPAAYRRRCRRFAPLVRRASPHDSAMDARRAPGGWRALARPGLSPCKRRQALLGAITLALTCCWKRERRRSGRWRQSGAALGSVLG